MKFKNAKVGDKVYSIRFGEGIITNVEATVTSSFEGCTCSHALDGRFIPTDINPDLYWVEPNIIERPRRVEKCINCFVNYFPERGEVAYYSDQETATRLALPITKHTAIPAKLTFIIEE